MIGIIGNSPIIPMIGIIGGAPMMRKGEYPGVAP
jgi:hypothetical protein